MSMTYDDYLEHYGVKGMKWGVRKSKKVTGESRVTGATRDAIARTSHHLKEQRAGGNAKLSRGYGIVTSLGSKRFDRKLEKRINKLDAADKRWREGKTNVLDKLDFALAVPMGGLFIEAKPVELNRR